ncbi:hypothetical protein CCACVL1_30121 [Corchorus capsularis]|uniref:Uncharacterized protein n=1 Tax=Corchorus capsularis TaxID=210143 RepID=A0A1R3FYT6_COCAP|nr:hypothetical protein CCACVL1_30121 [Corchorus capsularis]
MGAVEEGDDSGDEEFKEFLYSFEDDGIHTREQIDAYYNAVKDRREPYEPEPVEVEFKYWVYFETPHCKKAYPVTQLRKHLEWSSTDQETLKVGHLGILSYYKFG